MQSSSRSELIIPITLVQVVAVLSLLVKLSLQEEGKINRQLQNCVINVIETPREEASIAILEDQGIFSRGVPIGGAEVVREESTSDQGQWQSSVTPFLIHMKRFGVVIMICLFSLPFLWVSCLGSGNVTILPVQAQGPRSHRKLCRLYLIKPPLCRVGTSTPVISELNQKLFKTCDFHSR